MKAVDYAMVAMSLLLCGIGITGCAMRVREVYVTAPVVQNVDQVGHDDAPGRIMMWPIPRVECAWCGATNSLEVHHVLPQHIRPDLANDPSNMIVLCRKDHEALGHKHDFKNGMTTNIVKMIEEGKR